MMNSHWTMRYPEIESRVLIGEELQLQSAMLGYSPTETFLDILEVDQSAQAGGVTYERDLDHDGLIKYFKSSESRRNGIPALRILFLHTVVIAETDSNLDRVCLNPSTAMWMGQNLGVSPIFFSTITTDAWYIKTGNTCFQQRDLQGNLIGIDGLYRYSCGFHGLPAHVWFSHDVKHNTSLYIMHNCAEQTKEYILRCGRGPDPASLLRPLAIDAFICEGCSYAWGREIIIPRKNLIIYEHMDYSKYSLTEKDASEALERLHALSLHLHIVREDLVDLLERLDFLLEVHDLLVSNSSNLLPSMRSPAQSLRFLKARTQTWKRWVINYTERTNIRINLFFNLSTQRDNRTNLNIAHFTSKIATETQKDSSSMITMAAVTMVFLPGTFISGIFSMVFFETSQDSNGRHTLTVSPRWWYFLVITIPLTAFVFVIWNAWRLRRNRQELVEFKAIAEHESMKDNYVPLIPMDRTPPVVDLNNIQSARRSFVQQTSPN